MGTEIVVVSFCGYHDVMIEATELAIFYRILMCIIMGLILYSMLVYFYYLTVSHHDDVLVVLVLGSPPVSSMINNIHLVKCNTVTHAHAHGHTHIYVISSTLNTRRIYVF